MKFLSRPRELLKHLMSNENHAASLTLQIAILCLIGATSRMLSQLLSELRTLDCELDRVRENSQN